MHIEDNTLDVAEGDEPPPPPPQATIIEAFQHFACLYIKYVQVFKRLEMCYDAMVHPQKRIDVKVKEPERGEGREPRICVAQASPLPWSSALGQRI